MKNKINLDEATREELIGYLEDALWRQADAEEHAAKLEEKLIILQDKHLTAEIKIDTISEALKTCLEDKSRAEGYCKNEFTGLDPQQLYDEVW